ncbi:MAG: WG repeat-containing protein [Bacteroidota bacterium]|nr:WG repeat-containing protein [Bacteroidota bacterium]
MLKLSRIFYLTIILTLIITTSFSQKLYLSQGTDGKYGFLDKNGEVVVPFKFDQVLPYHNGLAKVRIEDKFGYIDKNGKEVIKCTYEYVSAFQRGLTKIYQNEKIAYFDNNGTKIYGWYNYIGNISYNLALVKNEKKYAYINYLNGKPLTDWYEYIEDFSEGKARVGNNNEYFFINRQGDIIEE